METLWPGLDPAVSKKYLRQALWRLNSTIQRRRSGGDSLILIDPGWVRINPDAACWVDVNAFELEYAATRDTPGHNLSHHQAHGVESAIELYRGDLIATWYHDWCGYERDRLQQAYLAMLDQLMGYCESCELYAKGVGLGQAALRYDAARECTHQQLMRLHCAAGDRASALRQYERCATILAQEFGIQPSAETIALAERIRAGKITDIPIPRSRENGHRRPIDKGVRQVMTGGEGYPNSMRHLLAELARLDVLLAIGVQRARRTAPAADDGLSPFYIPEAEIDALLSQPVAETTEDTPELSARLDQVSAEIAERVQASVQQDVYLRLVALAELFSLPPFEVDVVVICLAPEIDRRYQRLYAYLHDDVTRRAPSVDLVLNLLCAGVEAKMAARRRLTAGQLVRHGLVALADDPAQPAYSLLDKNIRLDPRIARFLLGDDALDDRLRPFTRVVLPDVSFAELDFPGGFGARLARLAEHAGDDLVLYCQGPYGVGKRSAAEACCQLWGAALLVVGTEALAARPAEEFAQLLALAEREARLHGAVMYFDGVDALLGEDSRQATLLATLAAHPGPAFLAGTTPWEPAGSPDAITFVRLEFPAPGFTERVRLWTAALDGTAGVDPAEVAGKFRLSGGQIRDAAATARNLAHARSPDAPTVVQDDLRAASRLQSNRRLATLARRITPRHTWRDIVLPAEKLAQLREIAGQVRYRALVFEGWGFERKVSGRGLSALFAGPSGTGKTMAAEVLAHELGLDLYKIDLSTVVSKYIGETEKHLARIFDEAETSNAILFFDEADALFGKRSQVNDAHDRYANLEISYLLQKLDEHEGVVILATNLRKNLDEAFVRRLQITIEFPVPEVAERRRIWEQIWPDTTPRDATIDLELLAGQVDLPGGNIRNIALAGAFLAAADGGVVTMSHLVQATRREYQKMGKVLTDGEFADPDVQEARHALPSA